MTLDPGSADAAPRGVGIDRLDADSKRAVDRYLQAGGLPQALLRVAVVPSPGLPNDRLPHVGGRYQGTAAGLRFVPHFPFERGVAYRAIFDPRPLGVAACSDVRTVEFSLPEEHASGPVEVEHIFPSSDALPENLLRFYVCFSRPMQRGRVEAEISLLGPAGEPAPDVLYRAPVELWDRSMTRLTVLLDPGRLKRGVGPNRQLGPPLEAGQVYTLRIGAGMADLSGRRLTSPVYKRFRVAHAVREPIDVKQWTMMPPATGSVQPLSLGFPRPLDWALLRHSIAVRSSREPLIEGRIEIGQSERCWSFTPVSPWVPGDYEVRVASALEDVCGNSVEAAFDRPIRPDRDLASAAPTRSLSFQLV